MGEPDLALEGENPRQDRGRSSSGRRRRRSRSPRSPRKTHARLRKVYFSLAAVWGFLIGTACVMGAMALTGRRLHLGPALGGGLAAAALLSVIGGIVVAAAYREASKRYR